MLPHDDRSDDVRLYDYLPSGNGYKARLVMKQLGIAYELVEVDIRAGASRTPEFLAKNPNGRIPVLEVPGKGFLPESHAIISFLAEGSALIPADAFERAHVAVAVFRAIPPRTQHRHRALLDQLAAQDAR